MYNADKNFSSLTKKYPCQQYGLLPDTYSTTFLFVILNGLTKLPLVAKNHPMLDESLHHDI